MDHLSEENIISIVEDLTEEERLDAQTRLSEFELFTSVDDLVKSVVNALIKRGVEVDDKDDLLEQASECETIGDLVQVLGENL